MNEPETVKEIERPELSQGRKFAEWFSFFVSAAVILALVTFLVFEGLKGRSDFAPVQVRPLLEMVVEQEGRFILPVRVQNNGRRTLHDLTLELEEKQPGAPGKTAQLTISYMGAQSERTVYFILQKEPKGRGVDVRPLGYQVE